MNYKTIVTGIVEFRATGEAEKIIERETGQKESVWLQIVGGVKLARDIDFGISFDVPAETIKHKLLLSGYVDEHGNCNVCTIWLVNPYTNRRSCVWGYSGRANWDLIGLEEINK